MDMDVDTTKDGLADWQKRVIDEYRELNTKRDKLAAFINSPEKIDPIDFVEKLRLFHQLRAMNSYSIILAERIGAFRQGTPGTPT